MSPGPRQVPEISGSGVLLTPWADDDAAAVLEMADHATRTWSSSMRNLRTEEDARAWMKGRVDDPDRIDWAVRDPETRSLAGRVGLLRFRDYPKSAEIAYAVHPGFRRRGVAREAVARCVRYGVDQLGLHRVELFHAVGNRASCAVAASSGFAYEGLEREAMDHGDGVLHDAHLHARLATDPPGAAAPPPQPLDPVTLTGDGLRLRPWTDDDAGAVLAGLSDHEVARWNPRLPLRDLAAARGWIAGRSERWADGRAASWAVEEEGVVVGSVSLREVNQVDRWATASYWTLPAARGRGVAPRALGLAAAYAVEGLGLHRVQLQHVLENTASCRVATKAGFALEGTQLGSCLLADGFADEHLHARVVGR